MPQSETHQGTGRVHPGFCLLLMLFALALFLSTYTARIESGDALRVYDAASSLVQFGDLQRDESMWIAPPQRIHPESEYSLVTYEINESFAPRLVTILYWLGQRLPGVGLVHMVYLQNIIALALSVSLLYVLGCLLGYEQRVAVLVALMFATLTAIWPYSKTLFREPLALLFLLVTTVCWVYWRARPLHPLRLLAFGLGCVSLYCAFLTKNSVLMALPALLALLLPEHITRPLFRRIFDAVLLVALFIVLVITFNESIFQSFYRTFAPFLRTLGADREFVRVSLHSYLFSVGGSIWGTSPVLLLALPGYWFLRATGRWRLIFLSLGVLAGYAAGHAFLTGVHWFGGLSWPPRFLIPAIPFLMIPVFSFMEWLLGRRSRYLWLPVLLIALYSLWIQIVAAISFTDTYAFLLPEEANGLIEWLPGLNSIRYLRWWVIPQSWQSVGFNIAWWRVDALWLLAAYLLLALGCVLSMVAVWRNHRWPLPALLIGLALPALTGFGLRHLYANDSLYWAHKPQLRAVLQELQQQARDGEPLLLADTTYDEFIMNYNDDNHIRPIIFGFQPGEAVSEREPAEIESEFPPDLLEFYATQVVSHMANQHDRIWLLAHTSPFLSWSTRPFEQYLGQYLYPLSVMDTDDPTVRLLSYSTIDAPNRYQFRLPEIPTDLRYGDAIQLEGVTLPRGTVYAPGEDVAATFYWRTDRPLEQEIIVAWFLVDQQARVLPVQGMDSAPDAGFAPTTRWPVGQLVYDNRAIRLPEDLPGGEYEIWLVLYVAGSGGADRLLVTSGMAVEENTIGVLPITLQISPQR